MAHKQAYNQLLTLIIARSQQWIRGQLDQMSSDPAPDDPAFHWIAEIAVTARVCNGLRGTEAPLSVFLRKHLTQGYVAAFARDFAAGTSPADLPGAALFQFLPDPEKPHLPAGSVSLADRLAVSGSKDAGLLADAEAYLCQPIPDECLTEDTVISYGRILALCYRFGAERPRFAKVRSYGTAFENCLRFADWAQRKKLLTPLAQMSFCLRLIDPDHDLTPYLSQIIASQRPDGSFPIRPGYGIGNQDASALRPTLATLATLHMAVHGRWRTNPPTATRAA